MLKSVIQTQLKLLFLCILIFNISCMMHRPIKFTPFEQDGLFGYKDENQKIVIPPEYILAQEFSRGGIAPVVDDKGWVYINSKGKKIIRPYIVDNGPDYFSEGYARFVKKNKFGFFDEKGRIKIKTAFDYASSFSEGLSAVCNGCVELKRGEHSFYYGGKWGYINKKGEVAFEYQFDSAQSFKNGRALVQKKGKSFYIINKKNK
jgi:hypothetical protein